MSVQKTVEVGVVLVSAGDAASSSIQDGSAINLLNNGGQTISGVASLFGPGATLATAPAAITLTAGKIITDVQNGKNGSPGDILSITGNTVAIVGAIGVAIGAPVAIPALAIGSALALLGVAANQGWIEKAIDTWVDGVNRDGKYYIYDPIVSNSFNFDPLVLDLDGDGIETVGHNGYKGALFDHDGDGIRTASGWVGKDDGLLVIDRNGDGVINDGRELFGDSYILKDGSKAAHGYAALAEYDENGDGKVDAQDTDFAKLRVWRDLNQDGISQQDELFTLEEAGVQSLNTTYRDTNRYLGNDNWLMQEGSYTDKEGKERKMGDLLFGSNTLYSRYSASVKLTDEQRAAANLQGTGRLRDLREAAALSPVFQSYYRIEFKQKQKCLWKEIQAQFKRSSETVFQTAF